MSECIREISDRSIRTSNIIFFNAPEQILNASVSNSLSDLDLITKISNLLFSTNAPKFHSLLRLGKNQQLSPRPRPLRVTFAEESHVKKVIDAFRDYKLTKEAPTEFLPPNLSLSRYKTPLQVLQYKKAKQLTSERMLEGESGLRIRYSRGVPTIVSTINQPTI